MQLPILHHVRRSGTGCALALVLLFVAAPISAPAHPGHSHDGVLVYGPPAPIGSWDGAEAAGNTFQQTQFTLELADAPEEVDGACAATTTFDDIGTGCRTEDGLLRIELADGTSTTTHGPDFMASPTDVDPATSAPHIVAAVQNASKADIACVSDATPHTQLVYAVPADGLDQYDERVDAFRQSAYEASAVIDKTSRSLSTTAGRRLRVSCTGSGEPVVARVRLARRNAGASFATVKSDLFAALGASEGTTVRFLVYYDGDIGSYAGIGDIYTDDRPGAENDNNSSRMVAMQDNSWGTGPSWSVLLHELTHNMGAVQDGAPDSNEVGHCNDGLDVMCYAEPSTPGVSGTYQSDICTTLQYDCGADSYFNPAPTGWLATHWNAAAPANRWLSTYAAAAEALPAVRDTTGDPLLPPRDVVVASTTPTTMTLRWRPSVDNGAWYTIERFTGTSWTWSGSNAVDEHEFTRSGLSANSRYRFRVRSEDQHGRASTWVEVAGWTTNTTDTTPPPAPANLQVTPSTTGTTPTLTWDAAGDATSYVVTVGAAPGATNQITSATSAQVTGLAYASSYTLGVVARDESGNTSARTETTLSTNLVPDTTAPTAPGFTGTAGAKSFTTIAGISWTAASDSGSGIAGYRILSSPAGNPFFFRIAATVGPAATSGTATGLQPGTSYCLTIEAFDSVGNSTTSATRCGAYVTQSDTQNPTQPGALIADIITDTSTQLSWSASTDNVGVAGYNVYRTAPGPTTLLTPTPITPTTFTATGLTASTAYTFEVEAVDVGGRTSTRAATSLTTTTGDVIPPTAPGPITIGATTASSIAVSWGASTDDSGSVARYEIRRNDAAGALLGTSTGTSTTLTGLFEFTSYTLVVIARDIAGNTSAPSASTTTKTADQTSPTTPTALSTSARTTTSVLVSWTASTDAGGSGIDRYEVFRDAVSLGTTTSTSFTISGMPEASSFTVRVRAFDVAGNFIDSANLAASTRDVTAPGAPGSASAMAVTWSSATLAWGAATDNVAVTGYRVYRAGDATPIATVTTRSYSLAGLMSDADHAYEIAAFDADGNESTARAAAAFRTLDGPPPDTTPPSAPGGPPTVLVTNTGTVTLTWHASNDDSGVIAHYRVSRSSGMGWFLQDTSTLASITLAGQPIGQSVTYSIEAVDQAGNRSGGLLVPVSIPAPPTPPAPPPLPRTPAGTLAPVAGLAASATSSRITVSWNAVDGATQYRIVEHRPGASSTRLVSTTSSSYTRYAPSTTVTFDVRAVDPNGESGVMSITAQTRRDTRRPSLPGRLTVAPRGRGKLMIRFNPARDDDRVARYELRLVTPRMRAKLVRLPASRRAVTISRLRPRAPYTVQVRAIDRSGNRSGWRTVRTRTR